MQTGPLSEEDIEDVVVQLHNIEVQPLKPSSP